MNLREAVIKVERKPESGNPTVTASDCSPRANPPSFSIDSDRPTACSLQPHRRRQKAGPLRSLPTGPPLPSTASSLFIMQPSAAPPQPSTNHCPRHVVDLTHQHIIANHLRPLDPGTHLLVSMITHWYICVCLKCFNFIKDDERREKYEARWKLWFGNLEVKVWFSF